MVRTRSRSFSPSPTGLPVSKSRVEIPVDSLSQPARLCAPVMLPAMITPRHRRPRAPRFQGQSRAAQLQYYAANNAVELASEAWAENLDPIVADRPTLDGKRYGAGLWDVVSVGLAKRESSGAVPRCCQEDR